MTDLCGDTASSFSGNTDSNQHIINDFVLCKYNKILTEVSCQYQGMTGSETSRGKKPIQLTMVQFREKWKEIMKKTRNKMLEESWEEESTSGGRLQGKFSERGGV